jgi:AcrR family transcriptional regulator
MAKRLSAPERRNLILDEASRLFAFRGLHGTTTKEIAKAAGISEPILYQHFKSKDEIYSELELICSQQTAYFKKVVQELGLGVDSLITITYLLIRVISYSKEPASKSKAKECAPSEILLRLMGYSFLEDGRFARSLVENCIGAFFHQWSECYKLAQKDGYLNIEKADSTNLWLAYESIIGFGMFILPPQLLVDRINKTDEASKAATLFVLRGMGVKESVLEKFVDWQELRKIYANALKLAGVF